MTSFEYKSFSLQQGIYDECMSSFFRNVDSSYDDPIDIPVGNSRGKIRSLKARVSHSFLFVFFFKFIEIKYMFLYIIKPLI